MNASRLLLLSGLTFAVACSILRAQPAASAATNAPAQAERIDFEKARGLFQKRQRGESLTAEEEAYVRRAMEARRAHQGGGAAQVPRDKTGLKPLTEMKRDERYKGEEGGLYGHGENAPPAAHARDAAAEAARIRPLDAEGREAKDGRVVLLSISMSNATQEFSLFKQLADADADKSQQLVIVDGAQGGQAMAEWAPAEAPPWREAERRIRAAGVSPQQVQAAWIKLANKAPRGDLEEHGRKLQRDTLAVIQNARAKFPNLRLAYLSSRIYGGYAANPLNPEPYAYESAFVVRWLIQDQIKGGAELRFAGPPGSVKAPLLLWGPYFWADGVTPRESDQLVWKREDLREDGTHPSQSGREKVARLLLEFFKTDPTAKPWFVR